MTVPTLSSSVTLKDQALWFGKIKLHEGELVISGWTWIGPTVRKIPLRSVAMFETWEERDGTNFRLKMDGASPIRGRIKGGIGLWEAKMEADERVVLKRRVKH